MANIWTPPPASKTQVPWIQIHTTREQYNRTYDWVKWNDDFNAFVSILDPDRLYFEGDYLEWYRTAVPNIVMDIHVAIVPAGQGMFDYTSEAFDGRTVGVVVGTDIDPLQQLPNVFGIQSYNNFQVSEGEGLSTQPTPPPNDGDDN